MGKKKKDRSWTVIFCVAGIGILAACSSNYGLRSNEFMDLYDRPDEFRPEAYVRQFSPDSAYVYINFRTDQLLYKREDSQHPFHARLKVSAEIKNMEISLQKDTVSYIFKEEKKEGSKSIITGRFAIHVRDTIAYEINVEFKDLHAELSRLEYLILPTNPDAFRYMGVLVDGEPKKFCSCAQGQEVELRPYWGVMGARWTSFEEDREPAPLPFSMTVNKESAEKNVSALNPKKSTKDGYKIPCPSGNVIKLSFDVGKDWKIPVFPRDYPMVSQAESLVPPLRYITTNDEYDDLRFSLDKKKSVSGFWLNCAPDEERAKRLLASYYKRVEESNIYFTDSFGEGWKSDRGLIYIAYGPPSRIIRESGKEVWYYSAENAEFGLQMQFNQGRRMKLDRSLDYRQSWYLTVDAWRNGKVSNL